MLEECIRVLGQKWFDKNDPEGSILKRERQVRALISKCSTIRGGDLEISSALVYQRKLKEHLFEIGKLKGHVSRRATNNRWARFCQVEPNHFLRSSRSLAKGDPRLLRRLAVAHASRKTQGLREPMRQAVIRSFVDNVERLAGG